MEGLNSVKEQGPGGQHHPHPGHDVPVTVDGVKREVPRGDYIVSQFKKLVGVDAARELDEVVHGELKPLDDNARIDIKGGEIFVSHVRTGGSS
jgi:hypothetical protein